MQQIAIFVHSQFVCDRAAVIHLIVFSDFVLIFHVNFHAECFFGIAFVFLHMFSLFECNGNIKEKENDEYACLIKYWKCGKREHYRNLQYKNEIIRENVQRIKWTKQNEQKWFGWNEMVKLILYYRNAMLSGHENDYDAIIRGYKFDFLLRICRVSYVQMIVSIYHGL